MTEAVTDKRRMTKDMSLAAAAKKEADPRTKTKQDRALMQAVKNHNPAAAAKKAKK